MRKVALLVLFLWAGVVVGCGDSGTDLPPNLGSNQGWIPPNPALLSAELQQHVDSAMSANHVPGSLVGVFTPAGSWVSATGFADLATQRPIDFSDYSSWRSITKSFTVSVVLRLVDEGLLELDAPVGRYVAGVPNGDKITLRQLAGMRSGLFNYTTDQNFINALIADLTQSFTDEQLLAYAFDHPVNFEPGAEYEYSNTNTILLGVVAEAVTGQDIDELYQNRIFGPLNLRQVVNVPGTTLPQPNALGYAYDSDLDVFEQVVINNSALSTAGGMAGTFADLRAWGAALVNGRLLSPALQRQRFESTLATNGPIYDSYGLGMGEIGNWWGHTGDALGYQAAVFTEPNTGSQIVILLNAANENHDVPVDIARKIQATLGWTDS